MRNEPSAMEALLERRSVRAFTEEPVQETDIRAIVRAGMHAPSAHNRRAWQMLTVTDRATLDALAPMNRWWSMLKEATLCVVTLSYSPGIKPEDEEFLVQDGAAATENMLLAIHALGLGGVWLGVHPQRPYYEAVKALLNIPAEVRVVSLIAAGRPQQPLPPRTAPQERFEEEKWHKERYMSK